MIEKIKRELQGRTLDYVLLTHSHYDHASGSVYVKDEWKDARVVGGAYAKKILEKPSARRVMREMNDNAARLYRCGEYPYRTEGLTVDLTVSDGDKIEFGGETLRVIEAPGHTRCSVSFFCEKERMLIACETLGVFAGEKLVMPCYLIGYEKTMKSIRKMTELAPEKVLVPHYGVLEGEACARFLESAVYWNEEVMRRVAQLHREGRTEREIADWFRQLFFTPYLQGVQPKKAFDLNLSYTVPMLLRECEAKRY